MVWKPHVTVAAVVEKDGKYLFVKERDGDDTVVNQPAGHLEPDETLLDAVQREVLEETGWSFEPGYLIGIYPLNITGTDKQYLRFCFYGEIKQQLSEELDEAIIGTLWLNEEELSGHKTRSPLVLAAIKDYQDGANYPLDIIQAIYQ